MRTTHDALRADGSPLLDTRAVPISDWTLVWDGNRIPVRVPSAWEDYGIPRAFEGPCDYLCAFTATPEAGMREWLHFGGASYEARGFVNDAPVGVHRGIWDSFCWDITDALQAGENRLRVQVIKNGGATYPVPQVLSGFLPYVSCAFGGLWQAVHRFQTGAAWLCDLWARGEADGRVDITGALGGALPATVRLTLHAPDGRIVAEARFNADAPQWTQAFQLAEPQPWSPAQPRLYRLVAEVWRDGRLSHRTETAFGLRTVAVDGATILLNGQPIYPRGILHWGGYLHTHAPNPDLQTAERELRAAQQCGFNMLKACLWVPSREYLRLCDRLGMLVWLELPLWLPQMDAAQIAHATGEYAAIVRQVRNHPSIVLWTLGCELSARFPSDALGELYALVKRLTGSPLVRDNSGGGECYGGALQEYADFADYHLYGDAHFAGTTFRAFLETPRAPAPWLQGEFADHDTMRDFPTLRRSVPAEQLWWLSQDPAINPQGVRWFYETPFVEARLAQAGLIPIAEPEFTNSCACRIPPLPALSPLVKGGEGRGEGGFESCAFTNFGSAVGITEAIPDLVQTSRREMTAYHKLVLETMRRLPDTSGYVVTGLKDTPISTAGILDERGELKIAPDEYAAFNADTVLLVDWHRRRDWIAGGDRAANPDPYNHFAGRTVYPRLSAAHAGAPLEGAVLRWRLETEQGARQAGEARIGHITAGVAFLAQAEVRLPDAPTPTTVRFVAELVAASGAVIGANTWLWGVYPVPAWDALGQVTIYDPTDALWGLPAPENFTRLTADDAPSTGSILLTTHWEPSHAAFVAQGGRALWLLTAPTPDCIRLPFWREAAHRFLPHPLWEHIPRPAHLDARLLAFSTDFALQGKAWRGAPLQPIWQRVDTRTGYTHAYLAEATHGAGRLLLCTLHFAGHHGETPITLRYHPAGQYWLWAMLRYLASR
jgi:hypothetical protein